MDKTKSGHRYTTYNSHPDFEWVPTAEDVTEHWPQTEEWDPSSFTEGTKSSIPREQPRKSVRKTVVIPPAPLLHI
ncbi:hypothetical protein N7454_007361 [Penicillium verhagenii]|nr:hypothetical protein N7454_007361 [Penicillium verhagenii]